MFTNSINPTLFKLGFLEIRFYGIVYVLGFLLLYYFLKYNKDKLNLDEEQVSDILLYILIGLLLGARFFHYLFSDPLVFIRDPLEFFKIWHGGMSFFGALAGSIVALYLYNRKHKIKFLAIADVAAIPSVIGIILGRIANFVNSELVGTVSNAPWCVVFTAVDNLCRHPYQLYAAFSHVVLLGIILWVKKLKPKDGKLFLSFVIGYCVLRFITDFFRADPRFIGLTVWQFLSVVGAAAATYLYKKF